MKRFIQNSCSWLAMLLCTVAFAVSGNVAAATVTLPLTNAGGTIDGISYAYGSCDWAGKTNIYGDFTAAAGWGYITIACYNENIVKVELTTKGDAGTVYEYNHNGSMTTNGNIAVWEGSAHDLGFTSSADVYVTNIVVYTEAGGGEGSGEATAIEMPLTGNTNGIQDGVTYNFTSRSWYGGSTNIYGNGDRSASYGTIFLDCYDKEIVKVELTCAISGWSASTSNEAAAMTVVETENLQGTMSTNGSVAVWEGSAHNLTFSSTDDIDVVKVVVYVKGGAVVVKDCSIDVDHFADNCKPGELQSISKWITLYMQANTATTSWTGSSNCPEGVTFTTEAGEEIPIDQFNYWAGSDQIGVNLYEEITTPGTYTLHIPEGLVAFEGGKFNKEITAVWTIKSSTPDVPEVPATREVTFDFTTRGFATEVDGVTLDVNGNEYNDYYSGLQVYSYGSNVRPVTFSVPEGQNITKVVINEAASATNYGLYNMYYYMEDNGANIDISNDYKSITWIGKANTVTFTPYGGSAIFATAIVTVESEGGEIVEPEPEPEPEPEVDLSKLVGDYLFHGEGGYNNDPETEILPEEYYEVSIEAVDGKLHMTGLLGNVYSDPYCYVGTYNTTDNTVTFNVPTYYNYGYVMVTDYDYFLINDSFILNVVEGEDGSLKFVKEDGWEFLFGWSWYKAGYTGAVELIKDGKIPAEPTGWNGEVLFPEATSIDELLSCTLEFDGAEVVTASNHDVLGVIYDETGDPYAIAMGNEVYSVFGGVSSEANKVSVNFIKIAELNANLQASARKAAARIGNFQSGNGSACVAFASKSFKVDGVLVDDVIAHKYEFAGNGTTTGIETIATEGNNATFDLSGRRVVNHANGLYIVGGRKVIK